jgi:peptidoglycan/LPS O-acetylase OafA/YrhL
MTRSPVASALAPAFSLYLDLLRAGSAIWVALSHLQLFKIAGPANRLPLPRDGHDAVVMFFVLSGFLVTHAVQRKPQQGLRGYALDRASRIYSVAVPLLMLSFACAIFGLIKPEPDYQMRHWYFYGPFFLTFLNESLGYREVPFLLYPWWSLAYEVWYYILFGLALFLRGTWRWIICASVFLLMGPHLWLLFPVWLCGAIAKIWTPNHWSRHTALFIAVATFAGFLLVKLTGADWLVRSIMMADYGGADKRPFGNASYFAGDYLIAIITMVHLVAVRQLISEKSSVAPGFIARIISSLANVSFCLYLLHPLIYRIWTDYVGRRHGNTVETIGVFLLTIAFAFLIAPLTEYRRHDWRKLLDKIMTFTGWQDRKSAT